MLQIVRQTNRLLPVGGVFLRVGTTPLRISSSPMFCTAASGSYTRSLSITTIAAGWSRLPNPPDPLPPPILYFGCRKRNKFAKMIAKPPMSLATPMRPLWPRALWTGLLHLPVLLLISRIERCRSTLGSKSSPSAHRAPSTQAFGPPAPNQGLHQFLSSCAAPPGHRMYRLTSRCLYAAHGQTSADPTDEILSLQNPIWVSLISQNSRLRAYGPSASYSCPGAYGPGIRNQSQAKAYAGVPTGPALSTYI